MKWLLVVVAFVLGAAITWFLTVKRVTRSVPAGDQTSAVAPEVTPVVSPGGPVGEADQAHDEADEADDGASSFGGAHTPTSEAVGAAEAWDRDAEDEDALMSEPSEEAPVDQPSDLAPVEDATANGDVAGVGEPAAVSVVDSTLPLEAGADEPDESVPPEQRAPGDEA